MIHFVDIPVIANNFGRKMIHKIQPVRHPPQTTPRKILTGLQILNRMMNPTIRSNIVAARDICSIYIKCLTEYDQCADHQYIGQTCRQCLQEYIGQEMSLYSFFIWLERQEESRYSDRKHADQRYLGWFHRIGNHQHYGE